jgi:hypothetical protein
VDAVWIYTGLCGNEYAFAALKADGSITTWGDTKSGGKNAAISLKDSKGTNS